MSTLNLQSARRYGAAHLSSVALLIVCAPMSALSPDVAAVIATAAGMAAAVCGTLSLVK